MNPNQIRTVKFMHRQDAIDLYRCSENGRVYARMTGGSPDLVRWMTTSCYGRGYEPSSSMKAGLTLNIVDGYAHELFSEVLESDLENSGTYADKKAPFSWEVEKEIAHMWAATYSLVPHKEWRKQLTDSRNRYAPSMDLDNWCYWEVNTLRRTTVPETDALGRRLYVECCRMEHRISHQSWNVYTLRLDLLTPLEICGYEWISTP